MKYPTYLAESVKERSDTQANQFELLRLLRQSPTMRTPGASTIDPQRRLMRLDAARLEALTRRGFIIGAGGLALCVALAGCELVDETDASVSGATRTVEHVFGTTEIPTNPQRIVVAGRRGILAVLLDLGFEPIAALDASSVLGQPFHPLIADRAAELGIEPIARTDAGPNLEQIVALNPDLIIGTAGDFEDVADQLAEIAPTVGGDFNYSDPAANVLTIAEMMGVSNRATEQLDAFQAEVAAVAAELPNPGTISIALAISLQNIRIFRGRSFIGQLVKELGGQIVPTEEELPTESEDQLFNAVSLEQVGLLSGDRVIFYVNQAEDLQAAHREFLAEPLAQSLPAIQADQVLEIDVQLAFGIAGLTGMRAVLNQLQTFFSS